MVRFNWRRLFPNFIIKNKDGRNIYNTLLSTLFSKTNTIMAKQKKPLFKYTVQEKPNRVMEIGLADGQNAMALIALSDCEEFYSFDILNRKESLAILPLLDEIEGFHFWSGDTRETLPSISDNLPVMDLVFIDGNHSYEGVKNDWEYVKGLMDNETVVFFHDYNLDSVRKCVREIEDSFSTKVLDEQMPEMARVECGS